MTRPNKTVPALVDDLIQYWFSDIDDRTAHDPDRDPFRTCYRRWYGKRAEVDDEIRERYGDDYRAMVASGAVLESTLGRWAEHEHGLLSLLLLVDQLPRNMFRGTAQMYRHDSLALWVASRAIQHFERDDELPLAYRMFLYVPLMHAEDLAIQEAALAKFVELESLAQTRSPQNVEFYASARGFAQSHLDVIREHGRFPHRNAILGRTSSAAELAYLSLPGAGF